MKKHTSSHRGLHALTTGIGAILLALASAHIATAGSNNTNTGTNSGPAASAAGADNTSDGFSALRFTTTGRRNTAVGSVALRSNIEGSFNTAIGYGALSVNLASNNTALGYAALLKNTTGSLNTALGVSALQANLTGASNVAVGNEALRRNEGGNFNVAVGDGALLNIQTADGNIGVGEDAGFNLTSGSNNIYLGNEGAGAGFLATESGKIRIGTSPTHTDTFLTGIIHGDGSGLSGITGLAAGAVTSAKLAANLTLGGDTTISGNATVAGGSSVAGSLFVDSAGANTGAIGGSPGLVFGLSNSGEGIASKRTAGGNQFGVDFYTGFAPRLSISNAGDTTISGSTTVGGNLFVSGPNARIGINNPGFTNVAMTLRGRAGDSSILDIQSAGGTDVFFVNDAGNTTIKGNATVGSTLGVTGNTTLTGNLRLGGTASRFNVNTGGFSNVTSVIRAGAGHVTTLDVQDSAGSPVFLTGSGGTTITGNSTVSGNSTVTGTLFANGSTSATLSASITFFSNDNLALLSTSVVDFASPLSIRAQNGIRASDFFASSDRRIKDIVGQSATRKDLETIERLKVTDYRMKDRVQKGNQLHKGFIAQEVQAVIPEAVTRSHEFIPSVYAVAAELEHDSAAQTVKVSMAKAHELKKGDKVRLISDDATVEKEVVDVPDGKTFVVKDIVQKPHRLFVYGREVDDFLAVDYNRIFTTAVGATQELASRLTALEARTSQLAASEQKAGARVAALEKQVVGLQQKDAEIAALKKQLAVQAAIQAERDKANQERFAALENAIRSVADDEPAGHRKIRKVSLQP